MEQITFHHLTHPPISYFHIRSEKTKEKDKRQRQKTNPGDDLQRRRSPLVSLVALNKLY